MIRVWFLPAIAVVLSFTFPQGVVNTFTLGVPRTIVQEFVLHSSFSVSAFGTLKCWQCDSDKNPDCGDPFNASKIAASDYIECKSVQNLGPAYCVKAVVVQRE